VEVSEKVGGGIEGGDDVAGVGEGVLEWCLNCGGHGAQVCVEGSTTMLLFATTTEGDDDRDSQRGPEVLRS